MGSPPVGFVVGVFVLVAFAGCIGSGEGQKVALPEAPTAGDVVAAQALVSQAGPDVKVTWTGPLTPEKGFRVTIPPGVTRVDATFTTGLATASSVSMVNHPSGRIRCQPDIFEGFFTRYTGRAQCSGLTVLDPLPATWRASPAALQAGQRLELTLSTSPLDGTAAQLNLDNLSMPVFKELPTEILKIPASSDGEPLHVEVTRPDTPEPVPAIIVSSPYNHATRNAARRPENSTIADWVPRGYAVVTSDVRGFGESGGCVEVWGPKEQQDQVDLVEWVAAQPWSSGKVGFYGQSYVGTTPVEAASLAAPHLTTIIVIAPVINAYEDWHFGGVPNGENSLSPASYQSLGVDAMNRPEDPLQTALNKGNGLCDPTLAARASDPRGVYDAFYAERDFKAMAKDVRASVLYTQGFYDENVKAQMIPGWFDALDVPKKAILGDWVHQHPPRADQELVFHAWFDHWLMGLDTGIMATPTVEVRTNVDTMRYAATWPPTDTNDTAFGLDFVGRALAAEGAGTGRYLATPASMTLQPGLAVAAGSQAAAVAVPGELTLRSAPFSERLYVSGLASLSLRVTLQGVENTLVYAELIDVALDGTQRTATFGMRNAALSDDFRTYAPRAPGSTFDLTVPFLPTEYVVEPGHSLMLRIRAADVTDWAAVAPSQPGVVNLEGAASALHLPTLAAPGDVPLPGSAGPVTLDA